MLSKIDLINLGFAKNVYTGAKSPALETLIFLPPLLRFKLHKWAPLIAVKTRQKIRELCIVIFRVGSPVITNFSALEFWTFPHKS